MNTQNYIQNLTTTTRKTIHVALRQTLAYHLYKNKIPCSLIGQCLHMTKRNIYYSIYKTRDKLEINDYITKQAYNETISHAFHIQPVTVTEGMITKHTGYKLYVDNVICE